MLALQTQPPLCSCIDMCTIHSSVPQPAFTPSPVPSWTSIASRDTTTRNDMSLKHSRHAKGVLVKPSQTHRTRVSHRTANPDPFRFAAQPATLQPRRATPSPQKAAHSKTRPTPVPSIIPPSIPDELFRELYESGRDDFKHEDTSQKTILSEPVVSNVIARRVKQLERDTKQPKKPRLSEERHAKAQSQKAYLAEQLDTRQLENQANKLALERNQNKPQKRARTVSRPRPSASSALKDSFQAYMREISREQLLGHSETVTLATRIKESMAIENTMRALQTELGRRPTVPELAKELSILPTEVQKRLMSGTAAKNTLVSANLRLVTSVARKLALGRSTTKVGLALEDMVQEGSVGLIRAAEKFDAARGYKFSTYATWWIRAYVMRSISTQSRSIKVPSTIVDEYARIRKEYARLRESGNFKPRDSEVARALGITPAKLRFVVNVVTRVPTSLDITLSPAGGDSANSRSLGEVVEGDDHIEERMVEELVRKELDEALRECLRPLERAVIKLRFGLEDGQSRTLRETGVLLGLSKERIRQIIFRALPKMKTPEIQRMLTDATTR